MGHAVRILAPILLAAALGVRAEDRKPPPATTRPANPLVGRWDAVSSGGNPVPREFALLWVIDDEHVTVIGSQGERISRNAYAIDRSTEPPQFVTKIEGERDRIGWFRFKGKELQLLLTVNAGEPPKSWEDGHIMVFRPVAKE